MNKHALTPKQREEFYGNKEERLTAAKRWLGTLTEAERGHIMTLSVSLMEEVMAQLQQKPCTCGKNC